MKPLGSIAALEAAVRDDAAADADAIEREAEKTIASIVAGDSDRATPDSADQRAVDAARDRARVRVAQEDWEDTRDALAERELWMTKAVDLGTRRLCDHRTAIERRETLSALVREAVARLPAGPLEIAVSETDAAAVDREWLAAVLGSGAAETALIATGSIDGGCVVRLRDGRASFDNTYAARAERLQTAWRAALADVYERAMSDLWSRAVPPGEPR